MIKKSTLPEDVRSVRRISFETKVLLESADALVLQALLKKLNEATRKAFLLLNNKSLSSKKRLGSKELLGSNVIQEGVFTAHQASMIGRSALGAYRLAAANAKVYEQKIQEMFGAVEKKMPQKVRSCRLKKGSIRPDC